MDILVDKDMNSLILVLPNDLSKRFSLVSGVKGVYRADMDNFDQDFLTILKGVRSLRWHTISSHAILHPNNSEETRFYMERELHRNLPHGDVSSTAAAQIGEDGKLKRPTLSPDAVAGLLGNNNTPSSAPFGFSQRQSVTIRRPGPAPPVEPSSTESAVHPPSHPPAHAGSAPAPSSSSVANQLPPTPSHPVHPAQSNTVAHPPAHAVPVSSKNAPPISPAVADQKPAPVPGTNSNTSSAIAGLAQRFLVRATSSPAISANMAAPSSTSATTHASQPTSNAQVPAASANGTSFACCGILHNHFALSIRC